MRTNLSVSRTFLTLISMILLIAVSAGTAFAKDRTVSITLTEEQLRLIQRAPLVEVTIQLTEDQISIIVHNFPRVVVTELTLSTACLRTDDIIMLEQAGRTGVNPIPSP